MGTDDYTDTQRSQFYFSHWHVSLQRSGAGNQGETVHEPSLVSSKKSYWVMAHIKGVQ